MREHNSSGFSVYVVTIAVIMFFAAIPAGIIIVNLIHQSFYMKKSYWYFESPMSSFILMISLLLVIPVVLIIMVIYYSRSNDSRKNRKFLFFTSVITIITMVFTGYLSIDNYYYINSKGIHYNTLLKLEEDTYNWEDLIEIKQINESDGGTLKPQAIEFTYKKYSLSLPLSPKLMSEMETLNTFIEKEKGIKMTMETRDKNE